MNDRLKNLYQIPERCLPQDVYLLDLAEQCAQLEEQVRELERKLPRKDRETLENYLNMRDELEFQSVKMALRFSKYVK